MLGWGSQDSFSHFTEKPQLRQLRLQRPNLLHRFNPFPSKKFILDKLNDITINKPNIENTNDAMKDYDALVNEITMLKQIIEEKNTVNQNLMKEIKSQEKIIELLQHERQNGDNKNNPLHNPNQWTKVPGTKQTLAKQQTPSFESPNRFTGLINPSSQHSASRSARPKPTLTVPGHTSYSNVTKHGKTITLFTDSIASRIKRKEMNVHVKGNLHINVFKGATAKAMYTYVNPTLDSNTPDVALIHVGTNDVGAGDKTPKEVANTILKIGEKCQVAGINTVMISALTKRKNLKLQKKINEVNDILADECPQQNFHYISNRNIIYDDICYDKLHLTKGGTCKLANNFINAINFTSNI